MTLWLLVRYGRWCPRLCPCALKCDFNLLCMRFLHGQARLIRSDAAAQYGIGIIASLRPCWPRSNGASTVAATWPVHCRQTRRRSSNFVMRRSEVSSTTLLSKAARCNPGAHRFVIRMACRRIEKWWTAVVTRPTESPAEISFTPSGRLRATVSRKPR